MSTPNSPNSPEAVKRLVMCVTIVLSLMLLSGLWLWPMWVGHRFHEQAYMVREGMPIDDVIRRPGPAFEKDEYSEIGGGDAEQHYTWRKGDTTFKVVVKDQKVVRIWQQRISL
jgi:hypothetical protein